MASRSFKKYANLGLDEEKDFFLASLNKRVRNARKKIEQIDDLSKKDKSTLKQEQLDKINSRSEVLENIKYVDDIKEMYYSAYKTAKEEGKAIQSAADEVSAPKSAEVKTTQETEPQVQQQRGPSEEERQAETARVTRDGLSKVLNLVHFAQLIRSQGQAQELRQALDAVSDLESIHELYTKIFTFSDSDKFVRIDDKLSSSLNELESYVNGAQQPALRNQSYQTLQRAVEKVAESSAFREHKADVSTRQAKTGAEHSAIGSELKKGHEQVEAPAKHKSPEKEVKTQQQEAATKVSPVKEGRRDWGTVEDEEEEEGLNNLREEEQQEVNFEGEGGRAVEEEEKPYTTLRDKQSQEEQKKSSVDDEWSTVTAKHKEKKPEPQARGGNRPFRGGDRGDRGGQRRPRPEGEGDQKRERRPPREQQGEGQEGAGEKRGNRGGYRGGAGQGGYQKRGGDVYQKKTGEDADKTTQ